MSKTPIRPITPPAPAKSTQIESGQSAGVAVHADGPRATSAARIQFRADTLESRG